MSDPIVFAESRLAEDERSATGLAEGTGMGALIRVFAGGPAAQAIGRRVLREVEAGHRILERHRRDQSGWEVCNEYRSGLCPDLADLLYRWADHPDYDQEWKP